MSHIVESCPLTKLNGGLSRLHSAVEDAVSWLTIMVNDTHTRRRRRLDQAGMPSKHGVRSRRRGHSQALNASQALKFSKLDLTVNWCGTYSTNDSGLVPWMFSLECFRLEGTLKNRPMLGKCCLHLLEIHRLGQRRMRPRSGPKHEKEAIV